MSYPASDNDEPLRSAAYNASAKLQEYAQKRLAQLERAKQIREERQRKEAERRAQAPPAANAARNSENVGERHLPTCTCPQCGGMRETPEIKMPPPPPVDQRWDPPPPRRTEPQREPPSRWDREEKPAKKIRSAAAPKKSDRPEWNSDFVDDAREGFGEVARRKQAQAARAERERQREQKSKQQQAYGQPARKEKPPPSQHASGLSAAPPTHPARQPVESSGNKGPATRMNFDKRTSRHMHRAPFIATIAQTDFVHNIPDGALPPSRRVSMFVRKRPLLPHELNERNEYDVVRVDEGKCRVVIHNCLMHADMHRMHIQHYAFPSTAAFGEHTSSEEVYAACVQGLVLDVMRGGVATILMNGQTGSGKTYTMTAIEKLAAGDIFSNLPHGGSVIVSMFEIAGKSCRDLLATSGPDEVTFMEGEGGQLHLCGACEEEPGSSAFLLHIITKAKSRRATQATSANATSSRSHAILRISILLADGSCCGRLILVDCAGSERKEDSANHNAERRKEGAEINSSLHALKECMRAVVNNNSHIPFRQHTLTKALRESFTYPGSHFAVISTVSPSATDTEHSIGTLRTACDFASCGDRIYEKKEDVDRNAAKRTVALPASPPQHHKAAHRSPATVINTNRDRENYNSRVGGGNHNARGGGNNSARAHYQPQQYGGGGHPDSPPDRRYPSAPASQVTPPRQAARNGRVAATVTNTVTSKQPHKSSPPNKKGGAPLCPVTHPNRWTAAEAQGWVQTHVHTNLALPSGTDGRALMRWPLHKCTNFCCDNEAMGLKLFNGLRLEVDKASDAEKYRRKAVMQARDG